MKKLNKIISRAIKLKNFLGSQVWKLFWISLALGVCLFLIESSFIFVMQGFLRAIGFVDQDRVILPAWYPTQSTSVILILILFGIFRGLVGMSRFYIIGAIGQSFSTLQRQRVVEFGLRYADQVSSGEVISLFTEKVTNSTSVLQNVSQLLVVLTSCLLFFLYGITKAPLEMSLGVTILAILMFPLRRFNSAIISAGDGLRDEWTNVNGTLIQGIRNNFFFKIYNLVEAEIQKAQSSLQEYNDHYLRYYKISALKNHTPNIIGIFIICALAYISVQHIHTKPIILITFFYLFIRFTQGLSEANTSVSNFKLHYKSFKELYSWHEKLERATSIKKDKKQIETLSDTPFNESVEISAENLSFSFPNKKALFRNLNFSIKKGEVLLIKGPSGAGKSTLLMLILGFLKPNEGKLYFNQHDIEKTLPFLSNVVGYVGPEPYLIIGTIRENILFGHHDDAKITDEIIIEVMRKSQLDITQFGLDFFVAEQTTLSTGQKQRLSIARALLRKPKLLILDEATANLDGDTEQKFTSGIGEILNEVTTIVISHKPSFDKIATTILTLEAVRSNDELL